MNSDLDRLQPYPFERLARLHSGVTPPPHLDPIALSIGEPRHPVPDAITATLQESLHQLGHYPTTRGGAPLRRAIAGWLTRRFKLPAGALDPAHHVLPVNGTREALFAFAQAVVERSADPLVLMPNPFYQIYEGAALLAGATPHYLPATAANGYLPDLDGVDDATWARCQLLYLCSPANPTGAVFPLATLQRVIEKAQQHQFIIAADECYSEIYADEAKPPPGLLQAAAAMGNTEFRRCVTFHSLSKRSNVPGMRSGFVAGDAEVIERFFRYRTYHGCAMPLQHQAASTTAWEDESHVIANRQIYREKFDAVLTRLAGVLDVKQPEAGFYLWPRVPIDDTEFARRLFAEQAVTLLPGSFLSREVAGLNPGRHHLRMALVPPLEQCIEAAERIRTFVQSI